MYVLGFMAIQSEPRSQQSKTGTPLNSLVSVVAHLKLFNLLSHLMVPARSLSTIPGLLLRSLNRSTFQTQTLLLAIDSYSGNLFQILNSSPASSPEHLPGNVNEAPGRNALALLPVSVAPEGLPKEAQDPGRSLPFLALSEELATLWRRGPLFWAGFPGRALSGNSESC